MAQRPSGWYDDPDDDTQLRYFDGILWTERRMPKQVPGLERSTIGSPQRPDEQEGAAEQGLTPAYDDRPRNPWQAPPAGGGSTPAGGSSPAGGPPQGAYPPPQSSYPLQPPYPQQGQWQGQPHGQQPYGAPAPKPVPLTPDGQRISGWWRRFGAYVIDGILVLCVSAGLAWPWSQSWFETYASYAEDVMDAQQRGVTAPSAPEALSEIPWQWALISLLVYAVYEITLTAWRGRTLGKMVTGISVRQLAHPGPPSVGDAAVRFLVKGITAVVFPIPALSGLGTLFTFVDGLWPLGDKQRQALHDKMPATVVVVGKVHRQEPLQ